MDTKAKPTNSFGEFAHQGSLQGTAGSDAFVNDAKGAALLIPQGPDQNTPQKSVSRGARGGGTHRARLT